MNTVVAQAMATGLPVITTNHSGLPEQVVDGKNGIVVPEANPEALAEAILVLMEHTERWPDFGQHGRRHAAEHYNSKKLIPRQIDYYNQVCHESVAHSIECTSPEEHRRLWNRHWADNRSTVTATIRSRFTREAFRTITAFVTQSDTSILETGCGTGRFCGLLAKQYPEAKVTGVDVSPQALAMARQLKATLGCVNLTLAEANMFQLPFRNDEFDLVFNEGVIQMYCQSGGPTYADALQEMIRVTKPSGKVIVSVVNWRCWPHTIYKWVLKKRRKRYEYGEEKSFRSDELVRLFRQRGLCNVETAGYYPSYGFYRLGNPFGLRPLLTSVGRLIDIVDCGWIARHFGFEIVVKGEKSNLES